jgi:hypothetical protein
MCSTNARLDEPSAVIRGVQDQQSDPSESYMVAAIVGSC